MKGLLFTQCIHPCLLSEAQQWHDTGSTLSLPPGKPDCWELARGVTPPEADHNT